MADLPNKQEFIDSILKAASENLELKEKLLKNSKEVFESMLNIKFPEAFEVVVHQDTPTKINIVLPYISDELTEVELSAVSGGLCWYHAHPASPPPEP